jgi:hypothetical protein
MKGHYKVYGISTCIPQAKMLYGTLVCTIKGRSREANYCIYSPNHTRYAGAFMRANDVISNSISTKLTSLAE